MMSTQPASKTTYYLHPFASTLRIAGMNQVDYLQRQVTNDVTSLSAGRASLAVLTTPMARILDVFYLFRENQPGEQEPAILALGLPGRTAATAAYLKSRIFFMDKVTLEDASQSFAQADLFGPQAIEVLQRLGVAIPQPGENLQVSLAGCRAHLLGHLPGGGLGFRLVFPSQASQAILAGLAGARAIGRDEYEICCVEAGLPSPTGELTEEYTPLEVGLEAAISDRKGCYTGQEVLARQVTYDKVTRRLAGLRLAESVPAGSMVLAAGKPAGTVTSAILSPTLGPVALAVLRRPYHEPGTKVVVRAQEAEVEATVASLPFTQE